MPPRAYADACGRETGPQMNHNHGSRPDRLAGILHARLKIRTRHHTAAPKSAPATTRPPQNPHPSPRGLGEQAVFAERER